MIGTMARGLLVSAITFASWGCADSESEGGPTQKTGKDQQASQSSSATVILETCEQTEREAIEGISGVEISGSVLTVTRAGSGSCATYRACWDQAFREEVPALAFVNLRATNEKVSCDELFKIDLAPITRAHRLGYPAGPHEYQVALNGWKQAVVVNFD